MQFEAYLNIKARHYLDSLNFKQKNKLMIQLLKIF